MKLSRTAGLLALTPLSAFAHAGEALEPHDLWTAWRFEPAIVIPLAVSAILYARGARTSRGVSSIQFACFWAGWVSLALSLVSPLHPLGEVLFSAHMVQHEVLMLISAPLLVLGRPMVPTLWGLPIEWRRSAGHWSKTDAVQRVWRGLTNPMAAWCIHAAVLWIWHSPALFQATLTSEGVHAAQHISFLGSALLFWWSLLYASGRASFGASVLYVFTTAVHTSILGALLTFSVRPWYPAYAATARNWGLSALEDQQLGGLIMWIPAGLVYVAAALGLFAAWLRESELMARRREYAG